VTDVAVPPSTEVALELGAQTQHVAVAPGREQQEALLPAEQRRLERRPLAASRP
jgi:hypothetical protein